MEAEITVEPGYDLCDGCGQEVDHDTCGCGSPRDGHDAWLDGHVFVPMGCACLTSRSPVRWAMVSG